MTRTVERETVGEVLMSVIKGERKLEEVMASPGEAWTALKNYVASVDWAAEWTWLTPLFVLEACLFILVVLTRRNITIQTIIFFILAVLMLLCGPINSYLAAHWRVFATQPLFDDSGSFISLVLALPLMIIMFTILINFYLEIFRLLRARQRLVVANKNKKNADAGDDADEKEKKDDDTETTDSTPEETKKNQ